MKFENKLPKFSLNADEKKILVDLTNYLKKAESNDRIQSISEVLDIDADTLEILTDFICELDNYMYD